MGEEALGWVWYNPYFWPREVAAIAGVSRQAIYQRCKRGTIEYDQPGGRGQSIYILQDEIKRLYPQKWAEYAWWEK